MAVGNKRGVLKISLVSLHSCRSFKFFMMTLTTWLLVGWYVSTRGILELTMGICGRE